MGPLVTREHRDKVASYIDKGAGRGRDGRRRRPRVAPEGDGFLLGVSLLDNVDARRTRPTATRSSGRCSGSRASRTYDEAVKLINDNPYGNGTAIFTRDGGVARQFQFDVQAGMVGINVPIPVPVAYYSFGGWKASLFGDTHIYGPEGIQFYTRGKVVTSRWPDPGHVEDRPRLPADALARRAPAAAGAAGARCYGACVTGVPASTADRRCRKSRTLATRIHASQTNIVTKKIDARAARAVDDAEPERPPADAAARERERGGEDHRGDPAPPVACMM